MACPTVTTTSTAWYQMPDGTCVEVEVIRSSNCETSIFILGTNTRIEPFDPTRLSTVNPCGADGPVTPVEIDSSCEDPVFVEVCNPATQPVQVISETEQLGCVVDVDGTVTGRVFFAPTYDADGNITATRMIMVSTDGTVTDPYTGSWEACAGSSDIEVTQTSQLSCADGVPWTIIRTEVYEDGVLLNTSYVFANSNGTEQTDPPNNLQIGPCEEEACVTCETLALCDTINNPDPTEGIPWNVVTIEEDADDPEHILHFHMSPADDPTKVGIVTFQSSTPFNANGCEFPGVDYAISNPSRRTITLDEVAQEMHAFQFNMIDFDTFEPTYIPTGFPIPTRLGGTAYWTGEPGNNVNILPTESNGTGLLIWDNPPETLAIQVGNTGGGNSCSNVDFEALTLSTMNRPFLRTICRDCEGNIVSTTDTDMDGVTPYEPVGEVTVCLASAGTSSNEQPQPPEEPWTTIDGNLLHDLAVNRADTLPGGAHRVSIQNVGEANGTVMGAQLQPGDTFEVTAYADPVTRQFVRVAQVPYDATGTTFRILRQG